MTDVFQRVLEGLDPHETRARVFKYMETLLTQARTLVRKAQ